MDFKETKELLQIKDGYRDKEVKRQVTLKNHVFGLQTKLLELRDKMATNRHNERIELIKIKVN